MASQYTNINGQLIDSLEAKIHISDLGLLRGMGIFDYFLVEKNQPRYFDQHINRFSNSCSIMGLNVDVEKVKADIINLIYQNDLGYSSIKVLVTGGFSDDEFTLTSPNVIIINKPYKFELSAQHESGANLITYNYQRELARAKTTNYLQAIRLQGEMKKHDAVEVLYIADDQVRECSRCNVFIVKDNQIMTPKNDMLLGVNRGVIVKGENVSEQDISSDDLFSADEVFITSTTKRVLPIVKIDGKTIGDGQVGKTTKYLMDKYIP